MLLSLRRGASIVAKTIGIASLVTTMLLIALQIITRLFSLNIQVAWAQELIMFGLIWIAFWGASIAFDVRGHIVIDFFIKNLSPKVQLLIYRITIFFTIVFFAILLRWGLTLSTIAWQSLSPTLGIPMGVVYLVIPFSSLINILINIADFVGYSSAGEGRTL